MKQLVQKLCNVCWLIWQNFSSPYLRALANFSLSNNKMKDVSTQANSNSKFSQCTFFLCLLELCVRGAWLVPIPKVNVFTMMLNVLPLLMSVLRPLTVKNCPGRTTCSTQKDLESRKEKKRLIINNARCCLSLCLVSSPPLFLIQEFWKSICNAMSLMPEDSLRLNYWCRLACWRLHKSV